MLEDYTVSSHELVIIERANYYISGEDKNSYTSAPLTEEYNNDKEVYSDKKGNVQYLEPEEILYEPKDFWDEAGKDKRKVKKLKISQGIY